jgi:hypothetical protein
MTDPMNEDPVEPPSQIDPGRGGRPGDAERLAAEARALGIRFVVRGLGSGASACLARTLVPDDSNQADSTVTDVSSLRKGIASMADALRLSR